MTDFATINKGHRAYARAMPAVTFRAWKIMDSGECAELDRIHTDTMDDAAAQLARQSIRGVRFAIVMNDAGRAVQTVRFILIRKRQGGGRRWSNSVGGMVENGTEYADTLVEFQAVDFEPKRPFDAFRDDPVGVDRTLVERRP